VRDVPVAPEPFRPDVRVDDGFRVEGYRVEVVGYCRACAE